MSIASGARSRLAYIAEVTQGTTPGSPALKILRATQRDINLQKNILTSNEIRSDRQKTDVRHGFTQVGGQLGFELSVGSYDDWLEAALSGTWATLPTITACTSVAAGNTLHRASGSFVTDGYRPGDIVRTTLYTNSNNNGTFRVTAVTASDLTLDATVVTLTNDTGGTITYPGRRLDIGTVLRTFTVERQFLDIVQYQVFKGVSVGQLTLNIKPEAMIGGTFTLVGMDGTSIMTGTPLDAAPTTPSTNAPCDAFKGSIYEGGTIIAVCTGLDLTLNNNRSVSAVVGLRSVLKSLKVRPSSPATSWFTSRT
jgi:hypothetical protein